MKKAENPQVEAALYTWFLHQRANHVPISSEILRQKARNFYENITGKSDFLASSGWLDKFRQRHGIRFLKVCGERLSSNVDAVLPFKQEFMKIVKEMDLHEDQIYNADESAIFWRALPTGTLVSQDEKSAPGRKIPKDRLTFMPCCNASGTHKLPLLILGKSKNPRVFKNASLPVIYNGSKKGWMTRQLFSDWFRKNFIPDVSDFLENINRPKKALLLIDNAPSHLVTEEMHDPNFRILLMPPNCTAIMQPMDQNLIQNVKVFYKKNLLKYAVSFEDGNITQHLKDFSLKNAVNYIHDAWEHITEKNIQKSWNKLLPRWDEEDDLPLSRFLEIRRKQPTSTSELLEKEVNDINKMIKMIDQNVNDEAIRDWVLGTNENVPIMTEDDIIAEVINPTNNATEINDSSSDNSVKLATRIKHVDAIKSFSVCIQWAEENNRPLQDVLLLKRLKEEAESIRSTLFKQSKVDSFFNKQ